jgi:hypothetical protein
MRLALHAQELPANGALTVGVSCANRIRKPVMDATRSSARPAFSFIERSTRSQRMGNVESEKGHDSKCSWLPATQFDSMAECFSESLSRNKL